MRPGSQDDWLTGPCSCMCKDCLRIGAHEAGHDDAAVSGRTLDKRGGPYDPEPPPVPRRADMEKVLTGPQEVEMLPFPTTDAAKWASEFVRLHGGDEGLMLAWFANAIAHGRGPDAATTPPEALRTAIKRVTHVGPENPDQAGLDPRSYTVHTLDSHFTEDPCAFCAALAEADEARGLPDNAEPCPVCGRPVVVHSTDEGTSYAEPAEADEARGLDVAVLAQRLVAAGQPTNILTEAGWRIVLPRLLEVLAAHNADDPETAT